LPVINRVIRSAGLLKWLGTGVDNTPPRAAPTLPAP